MKKTSLICLDLYLEAIILLTGQPEFFVDHFSAVYALYECFENEVPFDKCKQEHLESVDRCLQEVRKRLRARQGQMEYCISESVSRSILSEIIDKAKDFNNRFDPYFQPEAEQHGRYAEIINDVEYLCFPTVPDTNNQTYKT